MTGWRKGCNEEKEKKKRRKEENATTILDKQNKNANL